MKPPYGYNWVDNKLMPNESLDNARLIWNMALKGIKLKTICWELTTRGIPTSQGKIYWQSSSVSAILKNPTYAGRLAALKYEAVAPKERRKGTFGKTSSREKPPEQWVYLEGLVEQPIITMAEYNAVRERLNLNQQYSKRNAKGNYLLRGLIECQLCHRKYYGVNRHNHTPGYICQGAWARLDGKHCQGKRILCQVLDEAVKIKVRNFLEHPDIYMAEASNKIQEIERTKNNLMQSVDNLEKQIQENIINEQKALRLLSEEAFKNEQKVLLTRRTWLEQEIARQKGKISDLDKNLLNADSIEAVRKQLQDKLDNATDEDWRMILETLGVKVYMFDGGTWDIEVNIPIAYRTANYALPVTC